MAKRAQGNPVLRVIMARLETLELKLDLGLAKINSVKVQGELMAKAVGEVKKTVADLESQLDSMSASQADLAGDVTNLTQQIADLKQQIADGTPVTQDQLEALVAKATDIASRLAGTAAQTP